MCDGHCDRQWGQEWTRFPVLQESSRKDITRQCQLGLGTQAWGGSQ